MSLNASKLTKVMTASGCMGMCLSSVARGEALGPSCGLPSTQWIAEEKHFQAEDLADVHWEGEKFRPCSLRSHGKGSFSLLSHTSSVASITSLSILLSGTSPSDGTTAQCKGQLHHELQHFCNPWRTILYWTCIQDTEHFSYVEREWHNWALWCDLNSQINIRMLTRPSPGISPLACIFKKTWYSQGSILGHNCRLMV